MTRETSLLLLQSGWIYLGLTIAVVIVFVLSWLYGTRVRRKLNKESVEVSSIFITSIFGFFAILVAFQLSGSTNIYETQRKLTVDVAITSMAHKAQRRSYPTVRAATTVMALMAPRRFNQTASVATTSTAREARPKSCRMAWVGITFMGVRVK